MDMLVELVILVSAKPQVSSIDLFTLTGDALYPPLSSIVDHP